MPAIYEHALTVPPSAVDLYGHVGNVEYVRWMQDAATAHSEAQGWPLDRYTAAGGVWVVRSHHIEYARPAFVGERIVVRTWLTSFRRVRCRRAYQFIRRSDRARLADAATEWVYCDVHTGRPLAIPASVRNAFKLVPENPTP